jgi:hypothetical protein
MIISHTEFRESSILLIEVYIIVENWMRHLSPSQQRLKRCLYTHTVNKKFASDNSFLKISKENISANQRAESTVADMPYNL